MNIVIPSAGRGSRMNSDRPKAFIDFMGKPFIEWAYESVKAIGGRVIIVALTSEAHYYRELNFWHDIIYLQEVTEGPACTVLAARAFIDNDDPLIIVNNDQHVIMNAVEWMEKAAKDGSIVTTNKNEKKYSYAQIDYRGFVTRTEEKRVISPNAMIGYNFYRKGSHFCNAADEMIKAGERVNGEFYTAPVYNYMIRAGMEVNIFNVEPENFFNFGTAEELEKSKERWNAKV